MITAIEIENFKGIGERQRIELKPITLLFGANSSGKSTVIQALNYACEIFERHNLDPDRTLHGGEYLDLGGFQNLAHKRNLSKPIKLRFELDLHNVDLPDYGLSDELFLETGWVHESRFKEDYDDLKIDTDIVSREIKNVWVEIHIEWPTIQSKPILTNYHIGLNDVDFAYIIHPKDTK